LATVDLARRVEQGKVKRARTRHSMIVAAIELGKEKGFSAPTIDDFIAAAGVARGTFHNHFGTKEELMIAIGAHVADSIDALITPLIRDVSDPAHRIAIAICQFIEVCREQPSWGWVLVQTLPGANAGWSEDMRFKIASVQAAAALGMGTLAMAIRTVLVERTPKNFAQTIAAMTLQAMGVEPEESQRVASRPPPAQQTVV
jgi:AcrR family transcriptional regulator